MWVRTQAQRGQVLYPRWHVSRKGSLATSRAVLKPEGGSRSPPASASHGHWSPALWAPWAGVGVSTMGEQASWRPRARRHCQGGFLGDSKSHCSASCIAFNQAQRRPSSRGTHGGAASEQSRDKAASSEVSCGCHSQYRKQAVLSYKPRHGMWRLLAEK